MKNFISITKISLFAGLLFILWSCTSIRTKIPDEFQLKSNPVRVAILPFDLNLKYRNENKIAAMFRKIFYNYFSYLGYIDLDINEIDRILDQNKLISIKEIYLLSPQKLGEIFDADALVYGNIIRVSNFTAGVYAETSIEVQLKMVDAHSGNIVWEVDSKDIDISGIIDGGTVVTLIQKQVSNLNREGAFTRVAEELSKKIVKTIPDPSALLAENIHLPEIYTLRTNINKKNKVVGEHFLLKVYLNGEKGMKASFDIGNWKAGIPMIEEKPGEYAGTLMLKHSDRIEKALIVGKLENNYGLSSKKIYEKGLVWFSPLLN